MSLIKVSNLFYYPVKSAAGIRASSVSMEERGPALDRQWMVIDRNSKFVTQRKHASMCLLSTQMTNGNLTLSAPGLKPITIGSTTGKTRLVRVWRDTVEALEYTSNVSNWLSNFFGFEAHLVKMPDEAQRYVPQANQSVTTSDSDYNGKLVRFADAYPTLLASQSSLDEFNSHLSVPIGIDRFRPNIVISGADPWQEDQWRKLVIGDVQLTLVSQCSRCIVPSINQQNASKEAEVINVLNGTRRKNGKTYFGINCQHNYQPNKVATISVGDSVEIVEYR